MWVELLGVGLIVGGAVGIWRQTRRPTPAASASQPAAPQRQPVGAPSKQLGEYDLFEPLGSGGMATVHLGRHRSSGETVAVKLIRSDLAEDSEFRGRFLREIELSRRLAHPNLVRVLDSGLSGSDLYLVMEYVEGFSLEEVLRQGTPELSVFRRWASQLAAALQSAHHHSMVHRDIKPANIMISRQREAKILDFGLALQAGQERFTSLGFSMGTPTHMAPEVLTKGKYSPATDQYALGIVFYEMLSGRLPFFAKNPLHLGMLHVNQDPPPLAGVPSDLSALVMRMLAKDPTQRFGSLSEVERALRR